jgi:hypothetical protein
MGYQDSLLHPIQGTKEELRATVFEKHLLLDLTQEQSPADSAGRPILGKLS